MQYTGKQYNTLQYWIFGHVTTHGLFCFHLLGKKCGVCPKIGLGDPPLPPQMYAKL